MARRRHALLPRGPRRPGQAAVGARVALRPRVPRRPRWQYGGGPDAAAHLAAGIAGAIDALLALDPDTLDDDELADAVVELHRQQSRLAAATIRLTAALDTRGGWTADGSRSCGAWLARRCRLPVGQARAEVRLGRRLGTMPETRQAFGAGDVTASHTEVLGSLNAGRTAAVFARDEAELVDDARCLSWPDFCVAIEYWRQHADPDGVERDAAGDEASRRVHLSPGLRGTGILDGLLSPLGRAAVATALARIEQELFDADWAQARAEHGDQTCSAHITRTPAQRRHDALVEMAHRAWPPPPTAGAPNHWYRCWSAMRRSVAGCANSPTAPSSPRAPSPRCSTRRGSNGSSSTGRRG